MKKIFITYGNGIYYDSIVRQKKMAEKTGLFDRIILYTDKDLPQEITNHELMSYKRGGGYWLWKPYIILKTLTELAEEDDIVVYSDGGNEVFADPLWNTYFDLLKNNNALLFKYWGRMGQWTRRNLLESFEPHCHNLHKMHQICDGLSIWNKKAIPIVREWYDIMRQHPEFVVDVAEDMKGGERKEFEEHRHVQSVLSCVAYKREKQDKIKILWEKSEVFYTKGQAVFFARIANTPTRKNGRAHKPVSALWSLRHKMVNFIRDIRQFVYRRIL